MSNRKFLLTRISLTGIEVFDYENDNSYLLGFEELQIFCSEAGITHKYQVVFDKLTEFQKVLVFSNKVYALTTVHTRDPLINYRNLTTAGVTEAERIIYALEELYQDEKDSGRNLNN